MAWQRSMDAVDMLSQGWSEGEGKGEGQVSFGKAPARAYV